MIHSDDERMLQELSRMAEIYSLRGNFQMAKKCVDLAIEVRKRMTRQNVVSMSDWTEAHSEDEREA